MPFVFFAIDIANAHPVLSDCVVGGEGSYISGDALERGPAVP